MKLAVKENIWSLTIAERGSDNQPIRFGICIAGRYSNNNKQRNESEDCQSVNCNSKTLRIGIFCYKLEDVVETARTSYIGRPMITQNYFAYSRR
jgi:hypothetical protein